MQYSDTIDEFMNVDRHGEWVPLYDPSGLSRVLRQDHDDLKAKHRKTVFEIKQMFPVYLNNNAN